MDIPHRLALCCACTVSLCFVGCAAHYPYQPYPYQQYPGGYYGQPGYMGPSIGVPPGGTQLNAPTPIESGTPNGGTSGNGGDAPMWNPDNTNDLNGLDNGGSGGSGNSVPNYYDPSPGDLGPAPGSTENPEPFKEDKTTFGEGQNPFGRNETPTVELPGVRSAAVDRTPNIASAQPDIELASHESFAEDPRASTPDTIEAPSPVELTGAAFEQPVKRTQEPKELSLPYDPNEMPNPFDHDPQGYRSLRGLVSYDDRTAAWSIIYDDKPSRDDTFGGVFTLADHPGLTVLNDNDVVYIEGHISDTLKDEFGKPRYIVEHLTKLKPSSQQPFPAETDSGK